MKQKIKRITWSAGVCTLFLAVLLMPLVGQVQADTSWYGGDGLWSFGSNWDTGAPPSGGRAFLGSYGTATYDSTATDPNLRELDINATGGKSMVLNHSSGTLTLQPADGNNDSLFVNATGDDGAGTKSYASYDLSGDGVLVKTGYEVKIGTDGTGYFNQSGGTFKFSGALYLGDSSTGHGIYTMTGGEIVAGPTGAGGIVLGEWGGKGEFLQSGGTVTIADLTLARQSGSTGIYTLSGDPSSVTLTVNSSTVVGGLGTGTFIQTGGTHTTDGLVLGQWSGSDGTYDLRGDGSRLSVTGISGIYLSVKGTGSFIQNDNSTVEANNLFIGTDGGSGSYELKGGSLLLTGVALIGYSDIGSKGIGSTFTQNGGTNTVGGNLVLGVQHGSNGKYDLSGDQYVILKTRETHVGAFGTGKFVQNGGIHKMEATDSEGRPAGTLVLGYNVGGKGTYVLNDGSLSSDYQRIGLEGIGTFIQKGGKNTVTGDIVIAQEPGSTGTYDFSGGSLSANNIFVNQGGLFKGAGTIAVANFVNSGIVTPGRSPGTLTINGNYTQGVLGRLDIELGAAGHDILRVIGDGQGIANLAGILGVSLYDGYTPAVGSCFDILIANAINGTFDSVTGPAGWTWNVAYLDLAGGITGGDGFIDTVRLTAAPVPVPPSVWLLGSGLLGLFGLRRKFRT